MRAGYALALAAEQASYDALVAELKAGNTAIDYQALRFARAELPGYNPYDALSDPDKGDLIRAMSGNDADRVAAIASDIIARDYTDIDAHAALSAVLQRRGEREQAAFELAVANGLLRSIRTVGRRHDARRPPLSWSASPRSTASSARAACRWRSSRSFRRTRGPVDALEVVNPANNERSTVYFNISRLFDAMSRLGGAQKSP